MPLKSTMPVAKGSQPSGDGQSLGGYINLKNVTNSKRPAETKNELCILMEKLELDLAKNNLNASDRSSIMSQLKGLIISGKANSVFSQKNFGILCQHGYEIDTPTSSREALKCVANILLLESKTRPMFVEFGYAPKAASKIKSKYPEDQLLSSRILFLISYDKTLDFNELFDDNDLAESINMNIAHYADYFSEPGRDDPQSSPNTMALSETLKLLFNLTQFYPHRAIAFSKSVAPILQMISQMKSLSSPLQQPVNYLINALLNLEFDIETSGQSTANPMFPIPDQFRHVDGLITILDSSISYYKEEQLESLATPLVTLLQKLYVVAPPSVRKHFRAKLLPSNDERAKPLGRSDTFASGLLRLSTSPVAPNLRESVSSLMFELSDQSPTTFVRNVGYGYASGFLMSHHIPSPDTSDRRVRKNVDSDGEYLEETLTRVDGQEVNPITGQRKDMEPVDTGPEMTDEEKEREAERLFVLFERLKATGIVNVVNPIEQAARGGRFEEIN